MRQARGHGMARFMAAALPIAELVAGLDEAGRGPLAGPVVAAAVILDPTRPITGLADSKTLSAARRAELFEQIMANAVVGIAQASVAEIDRLNILAASLLAMRRACARLRVRPNRCLVDGNQDPGLGIPTQLIIGGDGSQPAIGAASIIAKVARDRLLTRLARRYPAYGWQQNAGYGTRQHLDALSLVGPTPHHRRSFAPVAQYSFKFDL
ncbi:MAG: ribonuclease HII [Sphingomonadales bacterium]